MLHHVGKELLLMYTFMNGCRELCRHLSILQMNFSISTYSQ